MKIHTDSLHKIAYSTDASVYREIPYGVAFPENIDDIKQLMHIAREKNTHLIPRAAGTSIAGQVVGNGIVVDISRHWNHILEFNIQERWARVEPGVVRDELNMTLKPYGLFFSPETSTSNRCCIGGMFGNNSCGTHSLIYGSTRHHIIAAKGILTDGSEEEFKDYTVEELEKRFGKRFWEKETHLLLIEQIYSQLIRFALNQKTVQLIENNYPDIELKRRSCGYAIDEVIEDLVHSESPWTERRINLCRLLAGSEGTLAFITEITVSLNTLPPKEIMVVCGHCDMLTKSFDANLIALRHHPTAIELMDGEILELSKGNVEQQKNRFFVEGNPAALLITELRAKTREELDDKAEALEKDLIESGLIYKCTRVYGSDVDKVWALRKAGLGILGGMKGDAKPMGVIEDTAVAPRLMPAYMTDFRHMLDKLHVKCVFYGHISTGELHLRPIINLKTREGKQLFRSIAYETARIVKKHRGSISGEHGDGRLRGEFIQLLYGDDTYELMREVKQCWDKNGLLNLHKIVDTLPMDSCLRFDENQQYAVEQELASDKTYFNWKAVFDECNAPGATGARSQLHALMCSIEQCNGAGDCRKSNLIGGTLCPAYKISKDEIKTTRTRANILREVLTRGWASEIFSKVKEKDQSLFTIPEIKEVLDTCLACKGCRSECPSNVDMTRIRAEILQHEYDHLGIPLRSWLVARMATIERLGSFIPTIYNFFARWKPSASFIKHIIQFAPERTIPILSKKTMRMLVKQEKKKYLIPHPKKKVYLFADEFTNFQEAKLGLTFAKLLMKLGYQVEIPSHVESGRAAISKGCLRLAKKFAYKNVKFLKDKIDESHPLIGIEPSCILTFRDEYPDLVPASLRKAAIKLGENCLLYDEFLYKEIKEGRITSNDFKKDEVKVWLHGHCHQKALIGIEKTASVLQSLKGATVNIIPSGCCGMAGSFGYEKEHYQTSMSIGKMILFPIIRKIKKKENGILNIVAAPGTSCRQQILDGTGVKAVHPIEILYKFLIK